MKFKLLSLTVLLGFSLSSFAMDAVTRDTVTIPDAATLTSQLEGIGPDHFMKKTEIVDKFAGTTLAPEGVALAIKLALDDHIENLKSGGMPPEMVEMMMEAGQINKSMLLEAILKDSPEALEHLKGQGLYTPAK